MTTADYLNQLEQDRQDLVDNLETQGITGLSGDETFTELVPEVLNISGGANLDDYFGSTIIAGTSNGNKLGNLIKKLPSNLTVSGTNLDYAFYNSPLLEEIPLFDTSNVTSMIGIFWNCPLLTSVPLLNTGNVTTAYYMFRECISLTTIPLIDTSKMTNFAAMFAGCRNLISIPQLDTRNVTNFSGCFQTCDKLETLPVLDTSKNTNFGNFFNRYCISLSNESLNNLLKMCINATLYTGTKTLYYLFSNTNMRTYYPSATIQSLSNYQDFIDAGWTIGW